MIFPKSVTSTLKGIPLLYGMIWIIVFFDWAITCRGGRGWRPLRRRWIPDKRCRE